MSPESVRAHVRWHGGYRQEWDAAPDEYANSGFVAWGRSRRLGRLALGSSLAYIGVQHVDPGVSGWELAREPHARFFASLFEGRRCVTLRTFPTMPVLLDWLAGLLSDD